MRPIDVAWWILRGGVMLRDGEMCGRWSDDLLFMMGLVRYLVEGSCRDLVEGGKRERSCIVSTPPFSNGKFPATSRG